MLYAIYTAYKLDTMLFIGVNKAAHLLNYKKTHAAFNWYHGSSMNLTIGQYSIQQPGALLKQLLIVYFKKM